MAQGIRRVRCAHLFGQFDFFSAAEVTSAGDLREPEKTELIKY
jgi:hypothetical protein